MVEKVMFEANTLQLSAYGMAPEGIAYDGGLKDRILIGSTTTGAVRGVSRPTTGGVKLTEREMYTYFTGGGSVPILSTKGMLVDPRDACSLWVVCPTARHN